MIKTFFNKLYEIIKRKLHILRWILLGICIVYTGWFLFHHLMDKPPEPRALHYLDEAIVIDQFKKNNSILQNNINEKLKYYHDKISEFYRTIYFTIALCILGINVVVSHEAIEVPGFRSIKIPTFITYLFIPIFLCYCWLRFGYLLHDIIGERIALINLIDCQYALCNKFLTIPATYIDYNSVTLANQLKDACFLDSWFLVFLPKKLFPTAPLSNMDNVISTAAMISIACLQGISHGLQLALPFNWIERFKYVGVGYFSIGLLFAIIFFIGGSHYAFYYVGQNPNWLQFIILGVAIVALVCLTHNKIRTLHTAALPKEGGGQEDGE